MKLKVTRHSVDSKVQWEYEYDYIALVGDTYWFQNEEDGGACGGYVLMDGDEFYLEV